MSVTTTTNGKPRKQLADQLDRLDGIIDALAEGLNGAVADAAREGTRLAIKDAIVEIMTNPDLRALLAPSIAPAPPTQAAPPAAAPPTPPKPGLWARIKARISAARTAIAGAVARAKEAVVRRFVIAGDAVVALGRATGETLPLRRVVLVGLGVGLLVGTACLVLPQTTAAVVGGIGAAGTAVSVQVGNWLTRAARRVGLMS
jgi:hypothetical protein